MGSGQWFKTIIRLKKAKVGSSKQVKVKGSSASAKSNALKSKNRTWKESSGFANGMPVEDIAATRIQTAFRAYKARKTLRRLKGIVRLQTLTQNYPVKRQATTTLSHLHSWSKIQAQIRARRLCMVTEGRLRQKKLENQLKLEAKLHDLEVEWCGGSETMDEILARIHQREDAAVKRERTMAYAFSHQWRANSSQGYGNYELSKTNWGWSWLERWIAARPWESRVPPKSISPKKPQSTQSSKVGRNVSPLTPKTSVSVKPPSANGRGITKVARRLSYPAAEKPAAKEGSIKAEEASNKKEQLVS
ncbi:protein IQ-DOMAIN 9-like [Corylus avellana]|uniref:protein IQ-DOMAIN 9-like n=1 Tax=Corylus avellana TaxID=13451 RepID=UPI00286CDF76|nr:protein IQ-DOMAIN 9-like [Corylus avellana]